MTDVLVALCTCPDATSADRIALALVNEGLAACVNELPGIRSVYKWQGEVHADPEVLLLIKTTQTHMTALQNRLQALHPYELPELIAIPVTAGSAAYLDWVRQSITSKA